MRTIRLFAILDHLRVHKHPISAEFLAEALEVSIRTIYRDMATLQAMGAPIRGEGGIGYQIERGYFLPPLHFDPDELDAVIIGMQLVMARGDAQLADAALRASSKINAVLSDTDKGKYMNSPLLAYSDDTKTSGQSISLLSPLRNALRERQWLIIDYRDLKGQKTTRRIRPLGLTVFDTVWLLTAWCETRLAFRDFRVDRIGSIQLTGENFPRENGKEFKNYLDAL